MKLSRLLRRRPQFRERSRPNHSGYEIFTLRAYFGHELHCSVGFHAGQQVLVAPVLGMGGLYVEQDAVESLEEPVSDAGIGEVVCDALLRFEARDPPSMAGRKKSDWPMYRKSGASSMRSFERQLTAVWVSSRHGELVFDARPTVTNHGGLSVTGMTAVSASHSEIGALLRRTVRGVAAMRNEGVV